MADPASVVREIVAALSGGSAQEGDARSWAELGIDSLDLVELALRVEEALGIVISDADLPVIAGPQALYAFVQDSIQGCVEGPAGGSAEGDADLLQKGGVVR
ncbi:MAG: hypothetical protein NVSMB32_10500 [Actinomycetota bacterium]